MKKSNNDQKIIDYLNKIGGRKIDVKQATEETGLPKKATNNLLALMYRNGVLSRIGRGTYELKVKTAFDSEVSDKKKITKPILKKKELKSVKRLVRAIKNKKPKKVKKIKGEKSVTHEMIIAHTKKQKDGLIDNQMVVGLTGISTKSASNLLAYMERYGKLARSKRGKYTLPKKSQFDFNEFKPSKRVESKIKQAKKPKNKSLGKYIIIDEDGSVCGSGKSVGLATNIAISCAKSNGQTIRIAKLIKVISIEAKIKTLK